MVSGEMRQQQLGDAFGRVLGGEMTDAGQDFLRFTDQSEGGLTH